LLRFVLCPSTHHGWLSTMLFEDPDWHAILVVLLSWHQMDYVYHASDSLPKLCWKGICINSDGFDNWISSCHRVSSTWFTLGWGNCKSLLNFQKFILSLVRRPNKVYKYSSCNLWRK
jgi:hypothetical protein